MLYLGIIQPVLQITGTVRSSLTLDDCSLQGNEGAPETWLEIDAAFTEAIIDLEPGLHQVTVKDIQTQKIKVHPLEALNGTPVTDIKPIIS
jgi:Uncharacterized conserved protein